MYIVSIGIDLENASFHLVTKEQSNGVSENLHTQMCPW
jgi:hypothetical protein